MLRGVSAEAPVLLYLEGGPGGTGIGRIRNSGEDLEQDFVVATWDQRGTGKSYDALDPTRHADRGPGGRGHPRGHRLPARPLRRGEDLPRRQLLGHHHRRRSPSSAPRAVPRLRRHRPDGRPVRDRRAHVRREPRGRRGPRRRRRGRGPARPRRSRRTTTRSTTRSHSSSNPKWMRLRARRRLRPRLGVPGEPLRRRVHPDRAAARHGRDRRDLRRAVPAAAATPTSASRSRASTCRSTSSRASHEAAGRETLGARVVRASCPRPARSTSSSRTRGTPRRTTSPAASPT